MGNGFIIAVDAGHGSNTAGKRTPNMPVDIDFEGDGRIDVEKGTSIKEHIANVGVCVFLAKELERCGFTVFKSAWNDEDATNDPDVDLTTRQERIRKASCQYSVSVHFNAFGDGSSFNTAEGVGTYYHLNDERINDSKALATIVQKYLAKGTEQRDRGVNRGGFAMVNCVNLNTKASILVELAFMTNKKEAVSMMGNAAFWKECAIEICKGFCEYLKVDYIEEDKETVEETVEEQGKNQNTLYLVQVGAFRAFATAQLLRDKVVKAGYSDAYIKQMTIHKKEWYCVLVGTFREKENAKTMLVGVHKNGFAGIIKEI